MKTIDKIIVDWAARRAILCPQGHRVNGQVQSVQELEVVCAKHESHLLESLGGRLPNDWNSIPGKRCFLWWVKCQTVFLGWKGVKFEKIWVSHITLLISWFVDQSHGTVAVDTWCLAEYLAVRVRITTIFLIFLIILIPASPSGVISHYEISRYGKIPWLHCSHNPV